MKKKNAEELLEFMIAQLLIYIDELSEYDNVPSEQFEYGEKTAYTECLEWIQFWEHAKAYGLDFDIEESYLL